jgi:outer membrane lipoprotein-sorting protein
MPGCTESGQKSPDAGELKNKYLENAGKIEDYQSEYHSKKDGLIFFDWKKPSEYRMEYRDSTKNAPGTLLLMNKTTAVRYDAEENTYRIMPEIEYLPRHDYQNMIRRAVRDEKFTITDTVQARAYAV